MQTLDLARYDSVLFFLGAGMSAESGVPTYRGRQRHGAVSEASVGAGADSRPASEGISTAASRPAPTQALRVSESPAGGLWSQYRYEDYACQRAFERAPEHVLDFHELRRATVLGCAPHAGHAHLASLQAAFPDRVKVVTQNIDGLLQRAGIAVDAELHGSLWRVRCACGVLEAPPPAAYTHRRCPDCGRWRRPDITWFEDAVDEGLFAVVGEWVRETALFVSIGTSGAVWPAAGFAQLAQRSGAEMVEINPEDNEASSLYTQRVRAKASEAIPDLFALPSRP